MSLQLPLLVCVVGPTAIGKTRLSIELAKAFGAEIISADSRQFYLEMRIGTAVPSEEELAAVPHHFIQTKSIFDSYSVGDFEREALSLLEELFTRNEIVIMVGGSGLYVDAVVKGLDDFPKVDPSIRQELNETLKTQGLEPLQEELKKVDPVQYEAMDIQNPQRVVRALEVFRSAGKPISHFKKKQPAQRSFNTLFIGLDAAREIVYERINARVDIMMKEGLLEEAKNLWKHASLNALQTVGYKELFAHFEGDFDFQTAVSEIKKNTRRFAKRQGTWFRKNEAIVWFDYQTPVSEIITYIKKALSP